MKTIRRSTPIPALVLFLMTWLSVSAVQAGEFSVQIGAFREAPSGFADAAEEIGPLLTHQTREGITRFQIGRFDSERAAQTARSALVGAGYADAFVVQKRVARRSTDDESDRSNGTTRSQPALVGSSAGRDPLAGIPDSLRGRVVILDGAYHVKDGDRFTPLAEALAAEN